MASRREEGRQRRCPVSIITDFGLEDPYVGVMKGVILGINPLAVLVDVTHQIAPQAVVEGAFVLRASWSYFPAGTVHLAVVDPGVGTDRSPVIVAAGGHYFVGPDNGLFTPVFEACPDARVHRITATEYRLKQVSATFHGRDIFAPAAAWLSRGVDPRRLGPTMTHPVRRPLPQPRVVDDGMAGEVVYVDRFGNLVTNIEASWVPREGAAVRVGGERIEVRRTYGEVPAGRLLALIGSFGFLEISVNGGSAAAELEAEAGVPVVLEAVTRAHVSREEEGER